jgi:hypothetical protein
MPSLMNFLTAHITFRSWQGYSSPSLEPNLPIKPLFSAVVSLVVYRGFIIVAQGMHITALFIVARHLALRTRELAGARDEAEEELLEILLDGER